MTRPEPTAVLNRHLLEGLPCSGAAEHVHHGRTRRRDESLKVLLSQLIARAVCIENLPVAAFGGLGGLWLFPGPRERTTAPSQPICSPDPATDNYLLHHRHSQLHRRGPRTDSASPNHSPWNCCHSFDRTDAYVDTAVHPTDSAVYRWDDTDLLWDEPIARAADLRSGKRRAFIWHFTGKHLMLEAGEGSR